MSHYNDLLTGRTFEDRLYDGGVGGRIFLERPGAPIFERNAFVIKAPGSIRGDTIHITYVNERGGPFKEMPTVRRAYLLVCNAPEIDFMKFQKDRAKDVNNGAIEDITRELEDCDDLLP